ncbi:zinc finger protein NUTCRACKER [Diospyros lotus]|uniref:zinc finger protein NUTCRACKER n=1 Tax=Diospyros lotus TaxID=55363 RepID=UPI002250F3F7|nr:zinc finger protein NUTCRACKER [Diospyros lotus]
MLEKMAEEAIVNGSALNQTAGSNPLPARKKRSLPGTPDPEAEVIALSPKTLMATNRFLCDICGKGFQRDQNLQLHRRGHNLPWKLKQRTSKEARKRVYVCPEKTCVHHHPSRALGDLTGIKKHFCRKHGEKKWKCEKCSKRYAVQSDWKAHSKTCGTREYKCDCGAVFSRRDSFMTHRAFCDALAEEAARVTAASNINNTMASNINYHFIANPISPGMPQNFSSIFKPVPTSEKGLSLWNNMGQGSLGQETMANNLHPIGSVSSEAAVYGDLLVSCSNPLPSSHQLTWVFGENKVSSNKSEEISRNSLHLSDAKDTGTQLVSVPSLYSSQHHVHQTPLTNMSATALLQKAAQIDSISSDPSFLGSYGLNLKCSNIQGQDGSKFCGFYGLGGGAERSENEISSLDELQMYPSKRRNVQNNREDGTAGGQTRDFLGVGIQSICHPSSVNGWNI